MNYTTIILRHADAKVPKFSGLPIDLEGFAYEHDEEAIEIRRWSIEAKAEAVAALSELSCTIDTTRCDAEVSEYWLERCTVDEDGWADEIEGPRFAEYKYVTPTKNHLFDSDEAMKVASYYAEANDLAITGTPVFDDAKDAWCVTATDDGSSRTLEIRADRYGGEEIEEIEMR